MAELNVIQQVFNVTTSNIVQAAWERGQELAVRGLVYSPGDGVLQVRPPFTPFCKCAKLQPNQLCEVREDSLRNQGHAEQTVQGYEKSGHHLLVCIPALCECAMVLMVLTRLSLARFCAHVFSNCVYGCY